MFNARTARAWIVPWTLPLAAVSGCAQSGPMLSQRTTVGSLKASVSHLGFENEQLRKEVASLKAEASDIEDQLVQAEASNGELKAQLDNARVLLSRRGGVGPDDPAAPAPGKTLPAARSTRKGRKTPFARIPGKIDAETEGDRDRNDSDLDSGWTTPTLPSRDEFGPQGRVDDPTLWLPIAQGTIESSPPRR